MDNDNSVQKDSKKSIDTNASDERYNNLKKEFDELYVVKSKLKEDLFKLVDKYRNLEREIEDLTKVKNQLKKDHTELGQKYIKLSEDSKKRINRLVRKETYQNIAVQSLLKENEILQNIEYTLNDFSRVSFDDLTIVIPYRESNNVRKINLRIVLDYLVYINIKNIIISEEYEHEPTTNWILEEYKNKFSLLKVITTKTEGLFSRSNLINKGVEESPTSFICIQDGDVVLPRNIFEYSLNLLDSGFDLVYPFNRNVNQILDKQSFIKNYDFEKVSSKSEFRPNSDGGMQFIKKESFLKIGGYNTNFKGWGSEDNEFILRVILGNLKFIRLNNSLYHLKHEKAEGTENNDDILIKSYNLYNTNDVNALINQNEHLMNTSLKYNKKYDDFYNMFIFNFKVSIIVPLNNPTKFLLERSIKSIMDQTLGFQAIEIILIDNCSTDSSSIDLIYNLTKKYGNIRRVILDEKIGFKEIYNIGIKESSTNHVLFLNYKNYLISNACEILYNQMLNDDADIVFGDIVNLVNNKKIKNFSRIISNKNFVPTKTFKLNSICDEIQLLTNDLLLGTKMFKKSFLLKNNFKLNASVSNQIHFLNSELLFNANIISLVDMPILVYDDYEDLDDISFLSHDIIIKNFKDSIEFFTQYYYLFNEFSPENIHIPLNSVSHWINNDLIFAKLKQDSLEYVINNISFLVDEFLKNESTIKPKNYIYEYFYKYVAEKDYAHAYEVYEVLCN